MKHLSHDGQPCNRKSKSEPDARMRVDGLGAESPDIQELVSVVGGVGA